MLSFDIKLASNRENVITVTISSHSTMNDLYRLLKLQLIPKKTDVLYTYSMNQKNYTFVDSSGEKINYLDKVKMHHTLDDNNVVLALQHVWNETIDMQEQHLNQLMQDTSKSKKRMSIDEQLPLTLFHPWTDCLQVSFDAIEISSDGSSSSSSSSGKYSKAKRACIA